MLHEDRVRILDMIDVADDAASFLVGRSRDDLDRDTMLFYALVRAVEIIGEAASKVSAETRTATPQIPWRDIVSMRNRLIHGYSTALRKGSRRTSSRTARCTS
jgi:uncharacterized protein with HEPN domain